MAGPPSSRVGILGFVLLVYSALATVGFGAVCDFGLGACVGGPIGTAVWGSWRTWSIWRNGEPSGAIGARVVTRVLDMLAVVL